MSSELQHMLNKLEATYVSMGIADHDLEVQKHAVEALKTLKNIKVLGKFDAVAMREKVSAETKIPSDWGAFDVNLGIDEHMFGETEWVKNQRSSAQFECE